LELFCFAIMYLKKSMVKPYGVNRANPAAVWFTSCILQPGGLWQRFSAGFWQASHIHLLFL